MVSPTTQAALEAEILHWRALIYADFVGDTLRATNNIIDKTVSGSSDTELNGTYESFTHNVISISPVQHSETGSDTVSIQMSGLIVNSDFLNLIGDKTKWQGRAARLWFFVSNEAGGQVGDIVPYYTGYMNDITIAGNPSEQTVTLTIENYVTSLSVAANRTYMMQTLYDPSDLSANATLSAANGMGASAGVTDLLIAGGGAYSMKDPAAVDRV
jgi:hypothetical protein